MAVIHVAPADIVHQMTTTGATPPVHKNVSDNNGSETAHNAATSGASAAQPTLIHVASTRHCASPSTMTHSSTSLRPSNDSLQPCVGQVRTRSTVSFDATAEGAGPPKTCSHYRTGSGDSSPIESERYDDDDDTFAMPISRQKVDENPSYFWSCHQPSAGYSILSPPQDTAKLTTCALEGQQHPMRRARSKSVLIPNPRPPVRYQPRGSLQTDSDRHRRSMSLAAAAAILASKSALTNPAGTAASARSCLTQAKSVQTYVTYSVGERLRSASLATTRSYPAHGTIVGQCGGGKESTFSDMCLEYMRFNGTIPMHFRSRSLQNQHPDVYRRRRTTTTAVDRSVTPPSTVDIEGICPQRSNSNGVHSQGPPLTTTPIQDQPSSAVSSSKQKNAPTPFAMRPNFSVRMTLRNKLFAQRKRLSDLALVFGVVGILLMVVETELTMANVYSKQSYYSVFVKSLISVSTLILLGIMFSYHRLEVQLSAVNNCIDDWRIAISGPMLGQIILELVVCAIHPPPISLYFTWTTVIADGHKLVTASVPADLIFSLPMFLRLYLICRTMLLHSILFSDAASRSIGALNRINFDTKFVVKTLMTMYPGTVLLVFMLTLCVIASWTLRACERYHDNQYESLFNAMWMIIITFLSIGYGDIVPNTHCGRGIAVCTGIMGSFCTALVVAVLAQKLELTRNEKFVHNFMMDNQFTKRMKHSAANVIRETWLIYKNTVLTKKVQSSTVRNLQRQLLQSIHSLRNVKMQLKMLIDSNNTLVGNNQAQMDAFKLLADMSLRQLQEETRTANMDQRLAGIQNQLEALTALVMQCSIVGDGCSGRFSLQANATLAPDDAVPEEELEPERDCDETDT